MSVLAGDQQPKRIHHQHDDHIHGIRSAATVISGHAQLVKRRARHDGAVDSEVTLQATLQAMETIERSVQRIETHLRLIESEGE